MQYRSPNRLLMKCLPPFLLACICATFCSTSYAESPNDEVFRLRLENAALKARINAGVAELTKPIDLDENFAGGSLEDFQSGRATIPPPPPSEEADEVIDPEDLPPEAQPTPMYLIHQSLAPLDLTPKVVLGDIGCGADARVLIEASRVYGCRGVGIEIDGRRARSARKAVKKAGLDHLITIVEGDASQVPWNFDVAYTYLWPETLVKIRPRLAKLKKFVSFSHYVPGFTMVKHKGGQFYSWKSQAYCVPQQQQYLLPQSQPQQPATQPASTQYASTSSTYRSTPTSNVAMWNGRSYNRPVCNSANCSMCNSIRSQLRRW